MARPRLGDSESKRLQMVITEDELQAIEDWRFRNRIRSKSDAIRRLVQIGLLVENELEQVVDFATECVEGMTEQMRDALAERAIIISPDTVDIQFGQEEVGDILMAAELRAYDASEAIQGLQQMIVTIYNATAPFAEANDITAGMEQSNKRIEEANAAAERLNEKRKERQENRYLNIAIMTSPMNLKQHLEYLELSDDEQDAYWQVKIDALAAEEARDPEAFAERFVLRRFWEKAGWLTRLRQRSKQVTGKSGRSLSGQSRSTTTTTPPSPRSKRKRRK